MVIFPESVNNVLKKPRRLVTLEEFSEAAGETQASFVDSIEHLLVSRHLSLETVEGSSDFYLFPAPYGRPLEDCPVLLGVTIWEALRRTNSIERSAELLATIRSLEEWGIDCYPTSGVAAEILSVYQPDLFAYSGGQWVPVVIDPEPAYISSATGTLSDLERGGSPAVVLAVTSGSRDRHVAAVRAWHRRGGTLRVTVCELGEAPAGPIDVANYGVVGENTQP